MKKTAEIIGSKIAILMSTYNGELFLNKQINSLLNQTHINWTLYVRDDGSTDNTLNILKKYKKAYPFKINIIKDDLGNLTSAFSFMRLLSVVNADYFMFCDQDDVWLPFKIEKTYNKMKEIELTNQNKGALVFTNLTIVDSKLNILERSMWDFLNINPENAKNIYSAAVSSTVTGCTMMINKALKNKVIPYPKELLMHDWWVSLNATHFASIGYIKEPMIYYRQHDYNVMGANSSKSHNFLKKIFFIKNTLISNFNLFKMLNALPFKISYLSFFLKKTQKLFSGTKNI